MEPYKLGKKERNGRPEKCYNGNGQVILHMSPTLLALRYLHFARVDHPLPVEQHPART